MINEEVNMHRRWLYVVGAAVIVAVWASAVRAQDDDATYRVYLPYVRRDPTPTPLPTPTPGPHCDVVSETNFESGMDGWTFSDGGVKERKQTDRVLDPFGPWVIELWTGEDGGAQLRSPAFDVPFIPRLSARVDVYFSYRSLVGRRRPDVDVIAAGFVRIPFRGVDTDTELREADIFESRTTKNWYQGGGSLDGIGPWSGWPQVQVRLVAVGENTDTRWQVDGVRVERCYE